MNQPSAGPDQILFLGLRQAFVRLSLWIRINAWAVALSLPLITIPAAQAGLYQAVHDALLDPFDQQFQYRESFLRGMRIHLWRSLGLAALNLAFFLICVLALAFWSTRLEPLRYVTVIAIILTAMWWLAQPLLLPLLIQDPASSILSLYQRAFQLVLHMPLYALALALAWSSANLIQILLLGPSLLFIPSFVALVSIQGLWGMTGAEIPDLADPAEYADRMSRAQSRALRVKLESAKPNGHSTTGDRV